MITTAIQGGKYGLDPDQNISTEVQKERGHYRRQYQTTARNGIWGTSFGRCGVRTLWRHEDGHYRIMPALCGCWSCLLCGPMRAAWLKRQLKQAMERYGLDYFWTLTLQGGLTPASWSDRHISLSWNRMRRVIQTRFGPMSFVWIREHTEAGIAHFHLLCDMPLSRKDVKALWFDATGSSYIVDVEPVESEKVCDYIAKYCTQEVTARAQPGNEHMRGKRLFSRSRDVKFDPFKAPGPKIDIVNEGTGEIHHESPWKTTPNPYWIEHKRLRMVHGPPIIERVIGQPHATFATALP